MSRITSLTSSQVITSSGFCARWNLPSKRWRTVSSTWSGSSGSARTLSTSLGVRSSFGRADTRSPEASQPARVWVTKAASVPMRSSIGPS